MTFQLDESLHWTDHFVEYGFSVVKGLVDRSFCEEAVEQIKKIVDDPRPLDQWTSEKPGALHEPFRVARSDPVLEKIYEQPAVLDAIETMHGPGKWNGRETFYIFLKPYEPEAKQELSKSGHIDFGGDHIPILYRGFSMMVSLVDTEPFSGNFTCWPGYPRIIQKMLIDDPKLNAPGGALECFKDKQLPEPYEFVAEPGDCLFIHHLLLHSGNSSHSDNRKPRCALLFDAWRDEWLTEIDPADPDLSPWERSLAHNGPFKVYVDERAERGKADPEVAAEIEAEKAGLPMPR